MFFEVWALCVAPPVKCSDWIKIFNKTNYELGVRSHSFAFGICEAREANVHKVAKA